jgi:ATP-binding cassette subfamily B protein
MIRKSPILKLVRYAMPYKRHMILAIFLGLLGSLLALANPYLVKLLIDDGISKKDPAVFLFFAFVGAVIFAVNLALSGGRDIISQYIRVRIALDLKRKLFLKINNFHFLWFQNRSCGENLYRIDHDTEAATEFAAGIIPQLVSLCVRLPVILALVIFLNWKMALFSLLFAPVLYFIPYYFVRKLKKVWESLVGGAENVMNVLEEIFSRVYLIKVFGKEKAVAGKYLRKLIANARLAIRIARWDAAGQAAGEIGNKIIIGLVGLYGGYRVISQDLTLGSLVAIMGYMYQLLGLHGEFSSVLSQIAIGNLSCQRLDDILSQESAVKEPEGARTVRFTKGEAVFKDVSFGYKPDRLVLSNMSFCVRGCSHIALAGYSGCGKTTLLNLLVRLFDPLSGQVIIDGVDIKEMRLKDLKDQIGVALQEPFLWNDTIENNIRFGYARAATDDIMSVARICGIDGIVKNLPDGYRTVIGQNAVKISEGQKQRIAIARAAIKRPRILVLDEAMSSLDSESEEKIISNIKTEFPSITLITVSHRLSTIMRADQVFYVHSPGEMIIDKAANILKSQPDFNQLFLNQANIIV